jgi:hypothetical protein
MRHDQLTYHRSPIFDPNLSKAKVEVLTIGTYMAVLRCWFAMLAGSETTSSGQRSTASDVYADQEHTTAFQQ